MDLDLAKITEPQLEELRARLFPSPLLGLGDLTVPTPSTEIAKFTDPGMNNGNGLGKTLIKIREKVAVPPGAELALLHFFCAGATNALVIHHGEPYYSGWGVGAVRSIDNNYMYGQCPVWIGVDGSFYITYFFTSGFFSEWYIHLTGFIRRG